MVLVTGGAGFIGSHVVDALIDAGTHVRVLDALVPAAHDGPPGYLNERAEYVFGDITDPEVVARCVDGIDAVSHQAAMVGLGKGIADLRSYVRHNDLGTATLLEALGGNEFAGRFILAGSMVVYGEGRYRCRTHGIVGVGPRDARRLAAGEFEPACHRCGADLQAEAIREDAPTDPRNVYAATKLHQEHLCAALARECDVVLTVLRYHNVFGPRMPRDTPYAGVASIFRSAIEAGDAPDVHEDGNQLRDFVHVTDVARANVLALLGDAAPGVYNIASGSPRTVGDLARELCRSAGPDVPPPVVTGRYRLGDVRHVFASPERARSVLGFTAERDFGEAIAEFAHAFLREPAGAGSARDV
jgi:dTDP-L-rhamnose 4-epimerase